MLDSNELFARLMERSIVSVALKSSIAALSDLLERSAHLLDTCVRYGEGLGVPDDALVDQSVVSQIAPSRDAAERLEALCAEYESRVGDSHEQYIRRGEVESELLEDIDRIEKQLKDSLGGGDVGALIDKPENAARTTREAYEAIAEYDLSKDAMSEIVSLSQAIDEMINDTNALARLISFGVSELISALDEPVFGND